MQKMKQTITPSSLIATVAVFLALGGAAFAATTAPRNSVVSPSIKNGTVIGKDVKDESLTGADIDEQSLSLPLPEAAAQLGSNTVGSEQVVDGSLTSADLKDDGITGGDIAEDALDALAVAKQSGIGRYGFNGACNPDSGTFTPCSQVRIDLPKPGRVLVIGTAEGQTETGKQTGYGRCYLTGATPGSFTRLQVPVYASDNDLAQGTLIEVSKVLPAGAHDVTLECNEQQNSATRGITFPQARMSVVALSGE